MEKARYNTELYSNLRAHLNNVKPSNFWGSHHCLVSLFSLYMVTLGRWQGAATRVFTTHWFTNSY